MNEFAFSFPWTQLYLWGGVSLVGLIVMVAALNALERYRARRLERFVEHQLAPRLLSGVAAGMRRPLFWLTLFGFGFAALAVAQPHFGKSWDYASRRSHDIMVCLDVSESMLAQNPQPDRLERAKQKIAAISDKAFGDRFGLIAFSGAAELMCPLTLDHGYYQTILAAVDTDSISLEGTDISAALKVAVSAFQDQDAEQGEQSRDSRAILLISDGESLAGDTAGLAKEASKYARIFVIGVGDPRGTLVEYRNRFASGVQLSPGETTHLSKLDESTLQRIAIAGRGGYIRATASNSDVDEIYGLIQQLFATDSGGDIRNQLVNRYQWPLAFAVACFFGEGLWLVLLPWIGWWRDRKEGRRSPEGEYA